MMNQTRRRVPPIPGVRDVLTAMDFVLAGLGKKAAPEFVAFREEIERVVLECETAIARAGKVEEIEALHEAATNKHEAAAAELRGAGNKAQAIIVTAQDKAQHILGQAANTADARTVGLDAAKKALNERQAVFDVKSAATTTALSERSETLDGQRTALLEFEAETKTKRKSVSAREAKLGEDSKKVDAQIARLKAAGFRDD